MSLSFYYSPQKNDDITNSKIDLTNHRKAIFFFILSFLILLVLLIFRNGVGTDYPRYKMLFYQIHYNKLNASEISWLKSSILFIILCKILSLFSNNPFIMFAVMGFLTLLFFYLGILKSNNRKVAFFIFFCFCMYFQSFNQMRQMLAVALVFYSYYYYKNEDLKKFVLFVLIAMGFHMSAAVTLLLIPLSKLKLNKKVLLNYLIISLAVYICFNLLVSIMGFIPYVKTYIYYLNNDNLGTNINLIIRVLMLFICLLFRKDAINFDKGNEKLYHIVIICTMIQFFATRFAIIGRVSTYFFVAYIYLLPEILSIVKNHFVYSNQPIIQILFNIALGCYFLIYYFSTSGSGALSGGYIHYKFLW